MRVIDVPEPLDLDLNLQVGQVFRWRKSATGWEGRDHLHLYRFCGEHVETTGTLEDLQRLFRLDVALPALHAELIRRGPELEPIIARWPGLRLMRPSCAREMLFTFLCTANNHLPRIASMVERMAALEGPGFPSLERLAEVSEAIWREMGFGYRGRTLPLVAREIIARGGEDWLADLQSMPYAEVASALETLPGVGPKLADCIALYAFDKTAAAPVDTHLWQAYGVVYGNAGKTLTDARKREVGEALRDRFGDLAGFAQQFLFVDHLRARTSA
jgi:N-glycosylase/DNA lyase